MYCKKMKLLFERRNILCRIIMQIYYPIVRVTFNITICDIIKHRKCLQYHLQYLYILKFVSISINI